VPQHSAILPAYGSKPIHANHMDMTKFESADDLGFVDVLTTLWGWARDLAKEVNTSPAVSQVPLGQLEKAHRLSKEPVVDNEITQDTNIGRNFYTFRGQNITEGGSIF
jgi:hypothetical protein